MAADKKPYIGHFRLLLEQPLSLGADFRRVGRVSNDHGGLRELVHLLEVELGHLEAKKRTLMKGAGS